jgi:hypothetical protein
MTKPPQRFKKIEDYTPAEHVEHQARLVRGEINPQIECEQYRAYRREVLRASGIELERRERANSEQEREAAASAEPLRSYQFAAEFLVRAEAVLEAHAQARAAEDHLYALGRNGKLLGAMLGGRSVESDLDADVIQSIPEVRGRSRGRWEPMRFGERFTIERVRLARALAEARAEEEARGDGIDWSGQPGARMRQRLAERKGE